MAAAGKISTDHNINNVYGSRSLEDGALYLVEERLKTFEDSSWPFDSGPCTGLKIAEAGFYYCGTSQTPDWVRCVVCHHDMEGWEPHDIPRTEHKKLSPKCAYLKLKDPYAITVGDVLELEREALSNFMDMEAKKLETDLNAYIHDTREELAQAMQKQTDTAK